MALHEPLVGRVIGVIAVTGIGLPLLGGGVWLWRGDEPPRGTDALRLFGWCSAGLIPLAVFTSSVILYERHHGIRLAEPLAIVVWTSGGGAVGGLLTGIYDLRRRRAHWKHQTTADRLAGLIEAAPVPIIEHAPDGTVRRWNDAAEDVLGWTADEVLGDLSPLLSGPPDEASGVFPTQVLDGEQVREAEIQCETKDGQRREFLLSSAPVFDESGALRTTISILMDVTERNDRKQELTRLYKAIDQAGHAIYTTDTDGTIEYANPAFEDVTGYAPAEAVGNDPSILKSGEQDEEYYQRLWSTIRAGEVWEEEIIDKRKSGELYTARQTIAPICEDDTIDGYVAIQTDVTAQRVREQRISVLNRILRHNLKNKVNVIAGRADLLLTELEDEDGRSYAETIRETASDLEALSEKSTSIKQALERTTPPIQSMPVDELIEQVKTQLAGAYPNAEITIDDRPSKTISIAASSRPALEELVENTVEHSDQSSPAVSLTVSVDQAADQVSIAVADTGPGIPEHERATLREGAETPLQHSNGLGLWLVRWVVTALGGKVTIDDNEPRGTVVTVTLPIDPATSCTGDDKTPMRTPHSDHQTTAETVDDSTSDRETHTRGQP
ncbi:MAG: PAS domain S-box protein [Halorientalis sp.]